MPNMTSTKRNTSALVVLMGAIFADKTLTAAGAETWPAGAVLATVTATGKMVRFNPGAAGGVGVPSAVLTEAVEFTAAGDRTERPLVAGQIKSGALVNDEDAVLSASEADSLRGYGIIVHNLTQLSIADNE